MEIVSKVFINHQDRPFLGPGRIALLKLIDKEGSITKAAKALKMSYKNAWDHIDAMNNLAPEPLIVSKTGGHGGGGSKLTPYAKELIAHYENLAQQVETFVKNPQWLEYGLCNKIVVEIVKIKKKKEYYKVSGTVYGFTIKAFVPKAEFQKLALEVGQRVIFAFRSVDLHPKKNVIKATPVEFLDDTVKVLFGDELLTLQGPLKQKGYHIEFGIDPAAIIVVKNGI